MDLLAELCIEEKDGPPFALRATEGLLFRSKCAAPLRGARLFWRNNKKIPREDCGLREGGGKICDIAIEREGKNHPTSREMRLIGANTLLEAWTRKRYCIK
jgi:hypothetical protein